MLDKTLSKKLISNVSLYIIFFLWYFSVYTRVDRYLNWIERQIGDRSSQRNQDISFQSDGNRRRPQGNRRGQNDRRRNRNRNNQNRFPNDVNDRRNDNGDEVVFG